MPDHPNNSNGLPRAVAAAVEHWWSVLPVGPDKRSLVEWGPLQKEHKLTDAEYFRETADIQRRLVAAGKIAPDEDPFETMR
jgi:hypothetical protein